jgi:6-phosphofructokinase 1
MPIVEGRNRGKKHYLVIVAEGVGGAVEIAEYIEAKTEITTRATILGYIQRGGTPTLTDRVMGSRFGAMAIQCLIEGKKNRIIAIKDNKLVDIDIIEALNMKKTIDNELITLSKILAL